MSITKKKLFLAWLPLAIMWIVMAVEQPLITSVISRLPDATKQLAAFGYSFALALFIEGPVVQMLSAGTAIVKSKNSYKKILKVMNALGIITVIAHAFFSIPLIFNFTAEKIFFLPEELRRSAYWCFVLMLPWSPAVGYRRLWQGVMIKHGKSKQVPIVMYIRIAVAIATLFMGLYLKTIPGAVVGGLSLSLGVIAGMISAYVYAKSILQNLDDNDSENLNLKQMVRFYIPLGVTSWVTLGVRPLLNLAITRGLNPIESLAIWPVILAYLFLYTSITQSLQEIIISEYKKENLKTINSFVNIVSLCITAIYLVVYLAKPIQNLWFVNISKLPTELLKYLPISLALVMILPIVSGRIAYYRAILVSIRNTASITLGVFINVGTLIIATIILPLVLKVSGVYIAALSYMVAFLFEVTFLYFRVHNLNKVKSIF